MNPFPRSRCTPHISNYLYVSTFSSGLDACSNSRQQTAHRQRFPPRSLWQKLSLSSRGLTRRLYINDVPTRAWRYHTENKIVLSGHCAKRPFPQRLIPCHCRNAVMKGLMNGLNRPTLNSLKATNPDRNTNSFHPSRHFDGAISLWSSCYSETLL
jgi:hypothetical protein